MVSVTNDVAYAGVAIKRIMLNGIMLNAIMLNGVMLNVVIPYIIASSWWRQDNQHNDTIRNLFSHFQIVPYNLPHYKSTICSRIPKHYLIAN
jgi:hypothetical protein